MKDKLFDSPVPVILAVLALSLTVGATAQAPQPTSAPAAPAVTASSPNSTMPGHARHLAATSAPGADLKEECQAIVAKKKQMQDKVGANDAALDQLVTEMNAAKGSTEKERTMAAVLNELVAQRKASHSMMMATQPEMMAHMMRHVERPATTGTMECPMMKVGMTRESKFERATPKN